MFQETFEIKVKKGKKLPKNVKDEDEGSEIEDDEVIMSIDDDEEQEILDFLEKAFSEVATVTKYGENEYMVDFYEPNTKLVEEDSVFDFDVCDNIPLLNDAEQFIPFVNFIKDFEPALTGITLYTNLEGGGHLVI